MLVKIKEEKESIKMIDKYIKYANKNEEMTKLLDDSVKRIIRVKEKYNVNDDISYRGAKIDEINKEIDKINKLCL